MEDIFCKIIHNEIPSQKIYEDDYVIAILDIFPATKGHTLVIPKKHYETILDIPSDELQEVIIRVQKLAKTVIEKLEAKGFHLMVNTNETAGQTVPHLHFHIIPRYGDDDEFEVKTKEVSVSVEEVAKILLSQ